MLRRPFSRVHMAPANPTEAGGTIIFVCAPKFLETGTALDDCGVCKETRSFMIRDHYTSSVRSSTTTSTEYLGIDRHRAGCPDSPSIHKWVTPGQYLPVLHSGVGDGHAARYMKMHIRWPRLLV